MATPAASKGTKRNLRFFIELLQPCAIQREGASASMIAPKAGARLWGEISVNGADEDAEGSNRKMFQRRGTLLRFGCNKQHFCGIAIDAERGEIELYGMRFAAYVQHD